MAITTREQLVEHLARIGVTGMAREGELDALFAGAGTPATVDTLGGATTVGKAVMKATDAAVARTAIGAGTSSVVVGTGATQAKAGNYTPTSAEVATALKAKAQVAALVAVSAPDATDATTAATLANANKVAINAIIAALKA